MMASDEGSPDSHIDFGEDVEEKISRSPTGQIFGADIRRPAGMRRRTIDTSSCVSSQRDSLRRNDSNRDNDDHGANSGTSQNKPLRRRRSFFGLFAGASQRKKNNPDRPVVAPLENMIRNHGKSQNSVTTVGSDETPFELNAPPSWTNRMPLDLTSDESVFRLEQLALQEEEDGQVEKAIEIWKNLLPLKRQGMETMRIRCKIAMLLLRLDTEESDDEAARFLALADHDVVRGQNSWLEPSHSLLHILMDLKSWKLALVVARQLPDTPNSVLARIHYETSVMLVETHHGKAVDQHLRDCHQLLLSDTDRSDSVAELWNLLAEAFANRGHFDEALACYQSCHKYINNPSELIELHHAKIVNVLIPMGNLTNALAETNVGLQLTRQFQEEEEEEKFYDAKNMLSDISEQTVATTTFNVKLQQLAIKLGHIKADLLHRLGDIDDSLFHYEKLIRQMEQSTQHTSADIANVLYTMGRVCVRSRRFAAAMAYFQRELEITETVVTPKHLAVSRILHELAKVAEKGLSDYHQALRYYQDALQVECGVLQDIIQSVKFCEACEENAQVLGPQQQHCCRTHLDLVRDTKQQIIETKRAIGRIHFMHGDFDSAVKTSFETSVPSSLPISGPGSTL